MKHVLGGPLWGVVFMNEPTNPNHTIDFIASLGEIGLTLTCI